MAFQSVVNRHASDSDVPTHVYLLSAQVWVELSVPLYVPLLYSM